MTRPFRGLLASAALLAGLGVDLTPPPREPEPTPEAFDDLVRQLREASIDDLALLAEVGGHRPEFMRRGLIELTARDLARNSHLGLDEARDLLDHMTQTPVEVKHHLFSRLDFPRPAPLEIQGRPDGKVGALEIRGRRGPGLQLRQERERVGEPLRILAAYTGLTPVEFGEIERGIKVPTPERWAALQVALPGLGQMEAPPTEAERSPVVFDPAPMFRGVPLEKAWPPAAGSWDILAEAGVAECTLVATDVPGELDEAEANRIALMFMDARGYFAPLQGT